LDILAAVKKPLLITSLGIACFGVNAQATTYYQSNGSSADNLQAYIGGGARFSGSNGATVQSASPFVVNGVSQGNYLSATSYPTANFTTVANATSQGIYVGLLLNPASANFWCGGFALSSKTTDQFPTDNNYSNWIVNVGWNNNPTKITFMDWNWIKAEGGYTVSVGQQVAIMAHLYDTGNTGTFNTATLYVDSDLSNGISFGSAIVTAFNISTPASTVGAIRLAADPGQQGETRYYDNVIASTSEQEAVQFLATGQTSAVPEPSTYGLIGVGALGVAFAARRRKSKTV